MAEPFKNWISAALVDRLAADASRVLPAFNGVEFRHQAAGLEGLELKARVTHVARAIRRGLPAPWPEAAQVLLAMLPPPLDREDDFHENVHVWPLTEVVAEFGLEHPALSLAVLGEMTRRWSSEFAIRPYIARWAGLCDETLDDWVLHPDLHVRRLVSEGSRPLLPWGLRLKEAVRSPERGLRRVLRLVDDPSAYVRRSVANHIGDVGKSHPNLAVDAAAGVLAAHSPGREQLVRHGLRALLKSGHGGALALMGQGDDVSVTQVRVADRVDIGGRLLVSAVLEGAPGTAARVDLVWQWPGARGWCSKTFRAATVTLTADPLAFKHALPVRSTSGRKVQPGLHRLSLRVNGRDQPAVEFTVG